MKLNKIYDINWMFPPDHQSGDCKIKLENFGFKDAEKYVPSEFFNLKNSVTSRQTIENVIGNMETGRVYDFSNVKTIYRYPKLNLSRDKVSMFCEDNDVKVIRNKHNSDLRIVSYALFNTVFKETWYNEFVPIGKVKEIVIKNHTCFIFKVR